MRWGAGPDLAHKPWVWHVPSSACNHLLSPLLQGLKNTCRVILFPKNITAGCRQTLLTCFTSSLSVIISVNLNVWKHWGCWPPLPPLPSSSPLVFPTWFIAVRSADRRCNWVMLQQFCQGNKTFALWTHIPKVTCRELLSGDPRWQRSGQHIGGCSAVKWRRHTDEIHSS